VDAARNRPTQRPRQGCGLPRLQAASAGTGEGQDFRVLDHRRDGGEGARLQASGRAYRSSVTLVLLHPRLAAELLTALTAPPDQD
jgi:hypothetical protein